MFEVRNISFAYARRPVLRGVSFVVSPGETVAIVGANGSGKTTLLKILATLAQPEGGSVLVDGQDALAMPIRYRRLMGYMPESPALYEDMTVKGYLRFRAQLKGEPEKRIRRRVGESVEMCQLAPYLRHPIRSLSAGLKKRVALADAMLLRPRVLLLDDFLSGLDRDLRVSSESIITNIAAFAGVVVTGHEIADMSKWTTRFLVLRDGKITHTVSSAGIDRESLVAKVDAALSGGAQ
ncbi:MAG: ABC transporter ATP-binding protein [Lentisphaerae bacterium]|jgi:ABC-2 type transport system ATP-binding protein|nr:ABC transporter ATP-binding protein [Lentisphaerota bacterium]